MTQYNVAILPVTTIAGASGGIGDPMPLPRGCSYLACLADFAYGSGGTTVKAWVQTSLDGGASWCDIMNFAFLLAAARKVSAVTVDIALGPAVTPTDGALADNTIVNGLLGDQVRVRWTSTGTYAGATSLKVSALPRPGFD
jgi:hypothetical protein